MPHLCEIPRQPHEMHQDLVVSVVSVEAGMLHGVARAEGRYLEADGIQ